MSALDEKQKYLAETLEEKQKNVQTLHSEVESKESELEELIRRKTEVNDYFQRHHFNVASILFFFLEYGRVVNETRTSKVL